MADHYDSIEVDISSLEKQPLRQIEGENDNISEHKRKILPFNPKYIHSVNFKSLINIIKLKYRLIHRKYINMMIL